MSLSPELLALVSKSKSKYASGGVNRTIKPKEGRNVYRILGLAPSKPWARTAELPAGQFWRDLGVHWIKPSETARAIAVVGAPDVVYDRVNPIQIAVDAAIGSALDEDTKKLYESWRARRSVLVNAVDIQDTANQDPQVLELTATTWASILDIYAEWGNAGKDITSITDGINLVVTRTGKGLNTSYSVQPAPSSAPLHTSVADKVIDLDQFIENNFFKGEEQKALSFIQQTTGVVSPLLAPASVRTPTAALASPAAIVPDAGATPPWEDQSATPPAMSPAAAPVASSPSVDEQRRQLEAQLAALSAPQPAVATPVAAPAPVAPAATEDQVLAELEGLLNPG